MNLKNCISVHKNSVQWIRLQGMIFCEGILKKNHRTSSILNKGPCLLAVENMNLNFCELVSTPVADVSIVRMCSAGFPSKEHG